MIKFSILIPTRNRVPLLKTLLHSIYESTCDKSETEIHVMHDDDDQVTQAFIDTFPKENPVKTYFHVRPRSNSINKDYYNWAATNFAQGEYLIMSNDDALFEMLHWDKRAKDKLDNTYKKMYPDGILYAFTEDFEHEPSRQLHNWMSCFPLVSKKVVDVLGYVFDPEYIRDGADWALAATFRAINRVGDLRDCIWIKHISFRSGRRAWDSLDDHSRSLGISPPPSDIFIERNKKKLVEYIQKYSMETH